VKGLVSHSDRFEQSLNIQNIHYSLEPLGEHVKAHPTGYDEPPHADGKLFFKTGADEVWAAVFYNVSTERRRYCGGNCSKPLMVALRLFQRPSLMP
jgi:hypothetical protein